MKKKKIKKILKNKEENIKIDKRKTTETSKKNMTNTLNEMSLYELRNLERNLTNFIEYGGGSENLKDYVFFESDRKDQLDITIFKVCIMYAITSLGAFQLHDLVIDVLQKKEKECMTTTGKFYELQDKIIDWGRTKKINDPKGQFLKVVEELGEIQLAKSKEEFMDAIGDTLVTLIILNDILQRLVKEDDDVTILTTDVFSEEELQEYSKQKTETDILGLLAYHINSDITKELGRIAGYISKMTEDNKSYYVEKIRLHILEVVKYVIYFSRSTETDYIECLQLAYDTIANRKGKTIDGVFVKEEDL